MRIIDYPDGKDAYYMLLPAEEWWVFYLSGTEFSQPTRTINRLYNKRRFGRPDSSASN